MNTSDISIEQLYRNALRYWLYSVLIGVVGIAWCVVYDGADAALVGVFLAGTGGITACVYLLKMVVLTAEYAEYGK